MSDIDPYKIPAFKRKPRISSKSRSIIDNSISSHRQLLEREARLIKEVPKKRMQVKLNSVSDEQLALKKRLLKKRAALRQSNQGGGFGALSSVNVTPSQVSSARSGHSTCRKMKRIGVCTHFFDKINVAVVALNSPIKAGDRLLFESEEGLFEQSLESMQIDKKEVQRARADQSIGTKVKFKPLTSGLVYKVYYER